MAATDVPSTSPSEGGTGGRLGHAARGGALMPQPVAVSGPIPGRAVCRQDRVHDLAGVGGMSQAEGVTQLVEDEGAFAGAAAEVRRQAGRGVDVDDRPDQLVVA